MRVAVRTYVNEGPGMFSGYEPGDRLVAGPTLSVEVARPTHPHPLLRTYRPTSEDVEHTALDEAWMVGNRMGADADGQNWPSDVSSLSVSDVLVIGETAWAVANLGFAIIPTDHLTRSLDPERSIRSDRLPVGQGRIR